MVREGKRNLCHYCCSRGPCSRSSDDSGKVGTKVVDLVIKVCRKVQCIVFPVSTEGLHADMQR